MINIKETLHKLISEAAGKYNYGKHIAGSEIYASPEIKKQIEDEREALLAAEESEIDDDVFLDSYAFRLLCSEALNNDQCLKKLVPSLGGDFTSDLKVNSSFALGIKYLISFYANLVEDYNNKTITGKVKIAIDSIREKEESEIKTKKDIDHAKQLTKLFTEGGKKKIPDINLANMPKDIINLCLAANIINWTRILTYQNSYNNDLMSLHDIFDPPSKQNKSNKLFVSNLSNADLDKFYSKKEPNIFATYLSQFPWGNRSQLTENKKSNSFSGVQGDFGKESDNDIFLLNCLISYLIDILKTGTPHPDIIFNTANNMSIQIAKSGGSMYEFGKVESMENPSSDVDSHWRSSSEGPDRSDSDPDFDMSFGQENIETIPTIQDTAETLDLAAMESFRDYVEELKKTNNWDSKNTLEFLSRTLKTKEGSDGLSAILKKTFIQLPGTVYGDEFVFPVILNNKIEYINLLTKLQSLTLGSNFMPIISTLADILSNMSIYKETKIESYIIKQLDNILIESIKETKLGLTIEDISALINNLPKTLDETLESYSIASSKTTGYTVTYNNQASKTVNKLYDILIKNISLFGELSPSIIDQIPPEGLLPGNPLQTYLNINIVPKKSVTAIGLSAKERSKGQLSVRAKDIESLETLWDVYYTAIKDIIDPTINISSWGLLVPTFMSKKKKDPEASYGILYNTQTVPIGSKADDGSLIKPLFKTPGEFSPVRDAVLQKITSLKNRFLSAKTLNEIKTLLQEIMLAFGNSREAKQVRFFASPATQTCPNNKKSPLYDLIDPFLAITPALRSVDVTHSFSEQHKSNNPFTDLVSSILVINNKTTNEAIINVDKTTLFESELEETSNYDLVACDVAINTHIRAKILLAVTSIIDLLEDLLTILREIITELKTVTTHIFSEDITGRADKFFSDISSILVGAISKIGKTSTESLTSYIVGALSDINKRFTPSEEKAKRVSALKQQQIPYTGKLYGSID